MSPPEHPRRGGLPGRITELNAAHGPHTPVPPASDTASTVPPPADRRPPPLELRAPRTTLVRQPPVAPPPLPAASETDEHTLVGIGPGSDVPQVEDGDRPSTVQALTSAETLTAQLAERNAELAALRKTIDERVDWERLAYSLVKRAGYKLLVGVALLLGATAAWIEARAGKTDEQIANVAAKTSTQKTVTDPLPARLQKLEEWSRGYVAHEQCVEGVLRSALYRATGYAVTSINETTVHWASENSKTWFPTRESDCPQEPAPPGEFKPP
jgi:hypothetical protein